MSDISEEALNEITQAIYAGQKILAIKHYRNAAGVGLKEAKSAVEGMERLLRTATPDAFRGRPMGSGDWGDTLSGLLRAGEGGAESMTEERAAKITEALFNGEKIVAVKLYREARGGGLKESKEAMDALEDALREECPEKFRFAKKRGCLGLVVLGIALVTWAATGITAM